MGNRATPTQILLKNLENPILELPNFGEPSIDARFESTTDLVKNFAFDEFTPNIFGSADTVQALVLRSEPAPPGPWGAPLQNMVAICRIVSDQHTTLLPDPNSFDPADFQSQALISAFPKFRYSAVNELSLIPPGTIVSVTFDPGSLQSGIVNLPLTPPCSDCPSGSVPPWPSAFGPGGAAAFRMGGSAYTKGVDMYDFKGRLVPATQEGCADHARTKYKAKSNILDEPIVTSTIVPTYKGNYTVKGKQSFIAKLETAQRALFAQGHPGFDIGDHLRSYESQRKAYMTKGQPGQKKWDPRTKRSKVAHPCAGYHTEGQAVDINQKFMDDILAHGPIYQALYNAGVRRINREYWHWSVGEASNHPRDKVFSRGVKGSPADTFQPGTT